MGRWREMVDAARRNPANVRFRDLRGLLERLGFVERRRAGSHRIYRHATRTEIPLVNIQAAAGGKAKPYQVRQVLAIIDACGLEVAE